jgi:hypothetical protein
MSGLVFVTTFSEITFRLPGRSDESKVFRVFHLGVLVGWQSDPFKQQGEFVPVHISYQLKMPR